MHQFDKVEMFSFVEPEDSGEEHERLLAIEEEILRRSRSPTAWSTSPPTTSAPRPPRSTTWRPGCPGRSRYRELTSCSNTTAFQARRLEMRHRPEEGASPRHVHTLNGTAVAVGRTIIAIAENHQRDDGTVEVPAVLHAFGAPGDDLTLRAPRVRAGAGRARAPRAA